jgi:hypothetical protein
LGHLEGQHSISGLKEEQTGCVCLGGVRL